MPDCPGIPDETYGIFSKRVHGNVFDERVPITGSLELTLRCNLRCVHCYCEGSRSSTEMDTGQTREVIDKIADAGCLWLLLTGGEPMLRPDFREIYQHVKSRGIIPTLFTNGTRITEETADFLAEWSPFWIEMSIYGATRETYEKVTAVEGSYDRCMRGIELLMERGINLKLKTMVLRSNVHELELMYQMARELGLDFRHDTMLNPTLGGGADPVHHRVDLETVIDLDKRFNEEVDTWSEFIRKTREIPPAETLVSCGAGVNSFHVSPEGRLSLCLLSRLETYDLLRGSFEEGWNGAIKDLRMRRPSESYRCGKCSARHLCGCCTAWAALETGDPEGSIDYLCRAAALRALSFGGAEARRLGDVLLESLEGAPIEPVSGSVEEVSACEEGLC